MTFDQFQSALATYGQAHDLKDTTTTLYYLQKNVMAFAHDDLARIKPGCTLDTNWPNEEEFLGPFGTAEEAEAAGKGLRSFVDDRGGQYRVSEWFCVSNDFDFDDAGEPDAQCAVAFDYCNGPLSLPILRKGGDSLPMLAAIVHRGGDVDEAIRRCEREEQGDADFALYLHGPSSADFPKAPNFFELCRY